MVNRTSCSWLLPLLLVAMVAGQDSEESSSISSSSSGEDLSEEKCGKERNGCCSELYIGEEEELVKCFTIHSSKLPPDGDSDIGKTLRFLSCFVECLYKQKKYIGKSDTINMKMVKLDAETTYADRPKEKEYHINMFEHCRKDAMGIYNMLKASPGAKALLKNACRPYLLMVFLCQSDYHQKHECPYFRWEGTEKAGTKDQCEDAKDKCYLIDGIAPPTKSTI
ncbi:uncharacterized protein Obp58d [Drosophila pseudoobscura]|uniref:Uncharacterized protein Obp58d n=1 Tax=Drosophila pseudoobscura pseudoobscura TaxID=46245 RepID=A0A6I8VTG9_DROPS|nr:uncharacterized protein LOC4803844 [Drosophila pseudoobscura]